MADGWDLHAVVRGCTASSSSAAVVPINNNINNLQDPLPGFASLTFNNDDAPFYYPGFAEDSSFQFQGLEEIYRSFNSQPPPINSTSSAVPVLGGLMNQQTHLPPPSPPPPPPQIQQQQLIQPPFKNSFAGSSLALPTFHSQTARSRRRKNQQTKLVRQMTHEELLADSWAWRKYGQKPIKGSPNPRNYYRCSTSKGCAARKQVEKSPSDPNMYVVSYTGDHTHPRPTHRNSLAGSTRNKFATRLPKPSSGESSEAPSAAVPNPSCSSSSPVSASSFSPTTPLMEGESAPHDNTQSEAMEIKDDGYAEMEEDTENDEEDLLIPNTVMSEDILKGFAELRGGFSGSNGLDSSWAVGGKFSTRFQTDSPAPWTPNSSTSAATTTSSSADGGGC